MDDIGATGLNKAMEEMVSIKTLTNVGVNICGSVRQYEDPQKQN